VRSTPALRGALATLLVVSIAADVTLVRRLEAKYDAFARDPESQARREALERALAAPPANATQPPPADQPAPR
jgi:hypothetical protein